MSKAWLIVWLAFAAYSLIASAGAGAFSLSSVTMICGFMIARNVADLANSKQREKPND